MPAAIELSMPKKVPEEAAPLAWRLAAVGKSAAVPHGVCRELVLGTVHCLSGAAPKGRREFEPRLGGRLIELEAPIAMSTSASIDLPGNGTAETAELGGDVNVGGSGGLCVQEDDRPVGIG
jgi:hypothetical protein